MSIKVITNDENGADSLTDINANFAQVPLVASSSDLDTGTNDTKFASAKAIKDSKNVPSVAPGSVGNAIVSNGTDWTSAAVPPTGSILIWSTATAPSGYLLCDASAVSRTTYSTLFSVISTQYGVGDNSTTFNLPDLRGRVAVGKSTDTEFDTLGETGGAKTHVLTVAELAAHTHTYATASSNGAPATYPSPTNKDIAATANTSSVGSNTAHNNLQPYITLNYIIKY